jgi:transposase
VSEPPRLLRRLCRALGLTEGRFWTPLPSSRGRPTWHGGTTRPSFGNASSIWSKGGRKVADVAEELGISQQTIYTWGHQARVDAGLEAGLSTAEQAELRAAKRRIPELETELAIHRRATEGSRGALAIERCRMLRRPRRCRGSGPLRGPPTGWEPSRAPDPRGSCHKRGLPVVERPLNRLSAPAARSESCDRSLGPRPGRSWAESAASWA